MNTEFRFRAWQLFLLSMLSGAAGAVTVLLLH